MATKSKTSFRGSIDDLLGDLLGSDDETRVKSARASQPAVSTSGRARGSSMQASEKSFLAGDFFSRLPAEDMEAAEGSGASDADPQALLQTLKDMDDMEADLLGISKPSSGPGKTTLKGPRRCDSLGGGVKPTGKLLAPEKGESVPVMEKKPVSSLPASRQYKELNFEDLDDPLVGLLPAEEQDASKKAAATGTKSSSEKSTAQSKEKALHAVATVRRREELTFEDDGDDLMDALGFDDGPKGDEQQEKKAEEEELQPARSKLDELLGRGSTAKILEQPRIGERRDFQLDKKYKKQPEKEEVWNEEDFVFGAYQPTVASTPKGQLARKQSVSRFSAENSSKPKLEPSSKPPPPASQSPVWGSRAGGDWLGLKDEDLMDSEPPSPAKASPVASYPSPATARQPSATRQLPAAEEASSKADPLEEEDWLSAALSREKAQAQAQTQERNGKPLEASDGGLDPLSPVSQPAASTGALQPTAALQDKEGSAEGSGQPVPWLSTAKRASVSPSEAAKTDPSRHASALVPTALLPGEHETQGLGPLAQVPTPRAHLQAVPQLQAESPALGLLHERRLGAPAAQLSEGTSGCRAALLSTQARVAELESQVRMLELERTQDKLLLESLQQRHREDLDLLESTHRSRVKVLEETYGQREERLRRDKEQLAAQLLSQSQDAEQARAELLAQHQQRLAVLEQQHTLEMERLRELQRVSVQEMRKDHEEQLQRLKWLKEQEVDAVTSATSHTRSLNGVIKQMEKVSSDLHDLSHKVEAMHHTASQELAMEARQRDKQFKVLQDRLLQQQRDVEQERSRFQEVIARMEARLGEQTRLLEQERWKATAERSKVESLQHSLEEQRRVMTHQLSMERAELERAKSALLEKQKSVMQKCWEEQRKLVAEWAEFHTRQQLSKERMEHHMDEALQMGSQREGTIISLAEEQAELKAKEEQLVRDRELLDKAWQELRMERKKVNWAALHIRQREEEMESMAKLSAPKYEDQALWEASKIESEHQSRLQVMQQCLEQRNQQEQRLHQLGQERLSMTHQRTQLEQLREELPSDPVMLLTAEQKLGAPAKGLSNPLPLTMATPHSQASVAGFLPPIKVPLQHHGRESLVAAGSTELYAKLLLLKLRAQQDHAFLEDEQFFLETLKKASYNTSPLAGDNSLSRNVTGW